MLTVAGMTEWIPSCLGKRQPNDTAKYRILADSPDSVNRWFYIEYNENDGRGWIGGLGGTQEWLGLSDEEVARAYPKKAKG